MSLAKHNCLSEVCLNLLTNFTVNLCPQNTWMPKHNTVPLGPIATKKKSAASESPF